MRIHGAGLIAALAASACTALSPAPGEAPVVSSAATAPSSAAASIPTSAAQASAAFAAGESAWSPERVAVALERALAKEQRVCRRERPTGSRIVRRICETPRETALRRQQQESLLADSLTPIYR